MTRISDLEDGRRVRDAAAADLYAKGKTTPLARDEYLALQDFLWRHILLEAGTITLPVHIHSSLGVPPFLRSLRVRRSQSRRCAGRPEVLQDADRAHSRRLPVARDRQLSRAQAQRLGGHFVEGLHRPGS